MAKRYYTNSRLVDQFFRKPLAAEIRILTVLNVYGFDPDEVNHREIDLTRDRENNLTSLALRIYELHKEQPDFKAHWAEIYDKWGPAQNLFSDLDFNMELVLDNLLEFYFYADQAGYFLREISRREPAFYDELGIPKSDLEDILLKQAGTLDSGVYTLSEPMRDIGNVLVARHDQFRGITSRYADYSELLAAYFLKIADTVNKIRVYREGGEVCAI